MTKFGFEWHLFIHFWYLWIITLVSGLGTMLCINTDW